VETLEHVPMSDGFTLAFLCVLCRSPGAVSQRTGAAYGDQSVRFNDDGRPLFPGMQKGRPNNGNLLFWRRDRELLEPEPSVMAGPIDTNRYRPYSRTIIPAQRPEQVRSDGTN